MPIADELRPIVATEEVSIALAIPIVAMLDDPIARKTDLFHDPFLRYRLNPGHVTAQAEKA
ncbi:hypothetical protein SBA3_3000002 [Candidatus Sulfopaludibacter sp. SbA3]|nr:hypothetical protein SBA3_3000002 [Candidatus Sulfopaludibacter sp. SbA3]